MKVTSGKLKHKNIYSLNKKTLRPTSVKVRQAIFNILIHRFSWHDWAKESFILEPYAGTGAVSIELLSNGILGSSLIEKDRDTFFNLKKNIEYLNLSSKTNLFNQDFLSFKNLDTKYKLIFLDPPYKDNLLDISIEKILDEKIASENSFIICESHKNHIFKNMFIKKKVLSKKYGKLKVTFFLT